MGHKESVVASLARALTRGTLALGLTVASGAAASAAVVVFPPTGTGMLTSELEAIGVVVADRYGVLTQEAMIGPDRSAAALPGAASHAAAARELGGSAFLFTSAVRLGDTIIVTLTLHDAKTGSPLHSAKMTAISMGDVAVVIDRLVLAVHGRKDVAQVADLDNITGKETLPPNRRYSERTMGFKVGGMTTRASGVSFSDSVLVSFDGRFETRDAFLRIGSGFLLSSDSGNKEGYGGLHAELGGGYYFSHGDFSPYIGAGLAPRVLLGDSHVGLGGYVEVGAIALRRSKARFIMDLRLTQNLMEMEYTNYDRYDYKTPPTTVNVRPTEVLFSVGVGW
jgi:hypothetical protein